MEHQPNVGAVDSHSEGNRRDDDVDRLAGEGLLGPVPLFGVETGVVWAGEQSLGGESGGQPLGLLSRDAVDDGGLAPMAAENGERLGDPVSPRHDTIDEVGAVERADQLHWIAEVKLPGDVGANLRGGGGGERVDARGGEAVSEEGKLPVFGAEVVAPLAYAVSLVDGEPLHADPREQVEEAGVDQSLGGGEQEP